MIGVHRCGRRVRCRTSWVGGVLLALLVLAGCGTTRPARYYLLTPEGPMASPDAASSLGIGVGPVTLAPYLDRAQVVTRVAGTNELRLEDSRRWAEPLAEAVGRVLAEDLARRLGTDQVRVYPWRQWEGLDYQVVVEVLRFDADSQGRVRLDVRWRVEGHGGAGSLATRRSELAGEVRGEGYAAIVQAQSRTLAGFADEIAAAVRALDAAPRAR